MLRKRAKERSDALKATRYLVTHFAFYSRRFLQLFYKDSLFSSVLVGDGSSRFGQGESDDDDDGDDYDGSENDENTDMFSTRRETK